MRGSEYIAKIFKDYGVTHVFHIEAMLRMTIKEMEELGIKAIMAHSENGAGYMADGYARISGRPGICMAQSIGAANLTGGIQDAYLAGSPLIALTGKKSAYNQYRNAYQESDHRLFYEAITKFNAEVSIPNQLPYLIRQCFRSATTGKPRPVHVDIPNRMGRTIEAAEITEEYLSDPKFGVYPPIRPAADSTEVREACEAINLAERPVIVIGRGARLADAGAEILTLAVKADIPVITTPDGKTCVDETSDLWSGICGEYGMDCANRALKEADLVIYFGSQTSDQTTYEWRCPPLATKVIQLDLEPSELGRNYPNTIGLLADAKVGAAQLAAGVNKKKNTEWREKVRAYKKETLEYYDERINRDSSIIAPERLCAELSEVLPENAVLVSDTGYAAVWTATMVPMKTTQRYLRAAGSLGWAFPASLGVKCGAPDRTVVCFTGDGGLYYHLGEMETAMRYGINTVTIVNNNGVLRQCASDIDNVFKNKEIAEPHYTFQNINIAELSKQMGFYAERVEKVEDIADAFNRCLLAGKPAILEVITDPDIVVPPAMIAR